MAGLAVAIKSAQTRRGFFPRTRRPHRRAVFFLFLFLRSCISSGTASFFTFLFVFTIGSEKKKTTRITKTPAFFSSFSFCLKTVRHLVCRVWRETLRTISNNVFSSRVGEGNENMEFLSKDNFNAFKCPYLVFSRKTCCCRHDKSSVRNIKTQIYS